MPQFALVEEKTGSIWAFQCAVNFKLETRKGNSFDDPSAGVGAAFKFKSALRVWVHAGSPTPVDDTRKVTNV
jgi:hypothetical protein